MGSGKRVSIVAEPQARTRSSNVSFTPAKTHDMVRSLFDPTLKKSFLECCISLTLIGNALLCYYMAHKLGVPFTKKFFLWQYIFWRLCYNLGIGIVLHFQSKYEVLTNYAKDRALFSKKNSGWLAKFCQFEINTKMPSSYKIESYPEEFNVWLLFRQIVDLILMQDFTTYILFVCLSMPSSLFASYNVKMFLGVAMIVFNIWVKLDAHRVVKDYAWYWGVFFFFQDSKLVFDGVFNISPHPMYSIGYLGYYGLSLISGDYKVLLISLWGHLLQFLFLKYCENPHIEKIYGSEDASDSNRQIDDLLRKENQNYAKPLITKGLWFMNFDFLRISDYFTVLTALGAIGVVFVIQPSANSLFLATSAVKLLTFSILSFILYKQSTSKWFTKLFLENGYTQLYSYQQWQFIYNFCTTMSYVFLILQTWFQFRLYKSRDYTQVIFGFLLCSLQKWCDDEILGAISEFGWFYGDFFLPNYINTPRLTSQGIYRYLSNPERFLGVAGAWGAVLITDFSLESIVIAGIWTLTNIFLVKFIEEPHIEKVYGPSERQSGVKKTLMGFKALRRFSEILEKVETKLTESVLSNDVLTDDDGSHTDESQWEEIVEIALQNVTTNLAPNCEIEVAGQSSNALTIPGPIIVTWKLSPKFYNNDDWLGIYRVLETGDDRHRTRISSNGRWTATQRNVYSLRNNADESVLSFRKTVQFVEGKVQFDFSKMFYEEGIYEVRYHSKGSHNVLMISKPFKLSFPQIDASTPASLAKDLLTFLQESQASTSHKLAPGRNKPCSQKCLKQLVKFGTGVDLSTKFLKEVNYDVDVISRRACEIRDTLASMS
ncbi:LAMI_0G05776g1_1 [Lachancea mirantina]|uniref:Phosphatidylethanolamine N-methyltransferase n=1 Tax=Lachancea mirantina TaxID=1230905 RepID=A0A1G4K8Y1_9SACH|nr:LAMI_0G05776g1_1 [Lachancea mirantina]